MIDEAHAIGVMGNRGNGLMSALGEHREMTVVTGTFGKSLASYGGFVACSEEFGKYLINRARTLIYSTALPPGAVAAAAEAVRICRRAEASGGDLLENSNYFRAELENAGLETFTSTSQIVPVLVGESNSTLRVAKELAEQGILVGAMRTPTVPEGSARLRCSLNLKHGEETLLAVSKAIIKSVADNNET